MPWLIVFALLPFLPLSAATAQLRFVNYNLAQLNGDLTALQTVFSAISADDKPGFAAAPHLYMFQEVQAADAAMPSGPIITRLNAAAPPGVTYARATFTTSGTEDGAAGAQCCFYRTDTLVEEPAGHVDIPTGASRNTDRWRFRLVGYSSPPVTFYVYSSHLPAGTAAANEESRRLGAVAIRANADALPTGSNIIYAGDWNVYDNLEPAYLAFIGPGNGQSIDPYGTGTWGGSGQAIKHTQSPCNTGCTLVGGGMDDRFDHQHATAALNDGEGLSRIAGANLYRAIGNDGAHYNADINAGNNSYYPGDIPRSNSLASALRLASDHLPVACEYQIPAVMSASLTSSVGRVMVGAVVSAELQVFNDAEVQIVGGADELDFSATASGALSGAASGSVFAVSAPAVRSFSVNTATVGPITGSVLVTSGSQGAQNSSQSLQCTGTVIRASNPSLRVDADLNADARSLVLARNIGTYVVPIDIANFGFDANQSLLDVDGITGVATPFSIDGVLPQGIGASPAQLPVAFDTDVAADGLYAANVTISTSDENLPGATTDSLAFSISVRVRTFLGDLDNDCDVELADLSIMLSAFGSCSENATFVADADLDNNFCVELNDLAIVLAEFGQVCP